MASLWGALGWWIVVLISIPFAFYTAVYVYGDFEVYKTMTQAWQMGRYDIAGLNILHHLRAWQIHSVAAEVFIGTGPFQFSPSFRRTFPAIHRLLGYFFVAASTVISISGIIFMIPNSEFGTPAKTVFAFQGVFMVYCLLVAVKMAKEKKFQVHQRYMIRAAATGYAVIADRIFPAFFIVAAGVSYPMALELSALISPIIFIGLAELYIRRVLLEPKEPTTGDTIKYVQTSSTEAEATQGPEPNGEDYVKLVDSKG